MAVVVDSSSLEVLALNTELPVKMKTYHTNIQSKLHHTIQKQSHHHLLTNRIQGHLLVLMGAL